MGIFFIHILKSSVCLVLFYLCYRILLSKETFHRFNRLTLLGIMILSFLLPFIEITLPEASEMSQPFLLLEEAMEPRAPCSDPPGSLLLIPVSGMW